MCKDCKCYNCGSAKDSGGTCVKCEECKKGENHITECNDHTSLE